jgi:hypothetical protein
MECAEEDGFEFLACASKRRGRERGANGLSDLDETRLILKKSFGIECANPEGKGDLFRFEPGSWLLQCAGGAGKLATKTLFLSRAEKLRRAMKLAGRYASRRKLDRIMRAECALEIRRLLKGTSVKLKR